MSPSTPRPGEELDLAALAAYLKAHEVGPGAPLEALQYKAGHSNLTYLLRGPHGAVVLRRAPPGAPPSGHDMSREFRILSALKRGGWSAAPRPLHFCDDPEVLGTPFYLMSPVEGTILRGPDPPQLKAATPGEVGALCERLIATLAKIHALPLAQAGLSDFGRPQGYIGRQVDGWTHRWLQAATDPVREMDEVAHWLVQHQPEDGPPALIHNDFKFDNVVFSPDLGSVRAVLDWEMATVGDPLMDLGTALAYWVEADDLDHLQALRFGPTTMPGALTRRRLVDHWAAHTGRPVDDILFYYVFGLFKVAVVGQQIYHRYKAGHTKDERFAGLLIAVQTLARTAADAIDQEQIGA